MSSCLVFLEAAGKIALVPKLAFEWHQYYTSYPIPSPKAIHHQLYPFSRGGQELGTMKYHVALTPNYSFNDIRAFAYASTNMLSALEKTTYPHFSGKTIFEEATFRRILC